jgi:hypothetical protein
MSSLRSLLSGGDRRSLAQSGRVRARIEREPARIAELAALAEDRDWLVSLRALDLLEKLAHRHPDWVEPHKRLFIGPLAESDKWEVRLQVVRALPLFRWNAAQAKRVEAILIANLAHPQTFVRAWALDSLASLCPRRPRLKPLLEQRLRDAERSGSKALRARARRIRLRCGKANPPRSRTASLRAAGLYVRFFRQRNPEEQR